MFHFFSKPSKDQPAPPSARSLLNRALFLAGGLVLLWLAIQLAPSPQAPTDTPLFSDASGTLATSAESQERPSETRSMLLLIGFTGLIALAGYLFTRRRKQAASGQPFESLGSMALGQQHQLKLVGCGDEALLIGLTQGQITLLKAYPKESFSTPPETEPLAFDELLEHASITTSNS